jgi:predicted ATPase/DNA-binding CsgD family transcriptional regulator
MSGIAERNDKNARGAKDVRAAAEEKISGTMAGRSRETELFQAQFDRVLEGGMGLTFVSGAPGVGKTFFVRQAVDRLDGAGVTYIYGKFRQYDEKPLIAFSEVIEQMAKHILTLPAESLNRIRDSLNKKLGSDAAIIASLCPFSQLLLDEHKPVGTDNLKQLKYRVRKAVSQFFAVVSTALYPLIVFIDDLQWADEISLGIVETFFQNYEFLNMQLVLAWRDENGVPAKFSADKAVKRGGVTISLEALDYQDIERYIRLIFGENIENKDHLARMLFGLTLGGPFNINRVLKLFLKENVIAYSASAGKWIAHSDKMAKLDLPADIEQLLMRQIEGLESGEKALLQLIACCGEAGFDFLKRLTGLEDALLSAELSRLYDNALLTKAAAGGETGGEACYGIVHDIVLKIAYNSLTPEEKSKLHYHIAATLSEQNTDQNSAQPQRNNALPEAASAQLGRSSAQPSTDDRLKVASHLLRADISLLLQDRPDRWIGELYEAGLAAKRTAAVERALEIFERCARLFEGYEGKEKRSLALSVNLELAECEFICERVEEAKEKFDALLKDCPEPADQLKIKRRYIGLSACDGDFEKVMELGHQILAHVRFKLESKHLPRDLIRSRLLIGRRTISRLESAPPITDERLLCILETLTVMLPATNLKDGKLSALISLKLAILSAKYGTSDYAPIAFAAYCYVLYSVLRDYKSGAELEKVALKLTEKCGSASSKSIAYCILGSLVIHWSNPFGETVRCLENSTEEGEREGASLYGSYAIIFAIFTKYMIGRPLGELKQYIDSCRKKQSRVEYYLTRYFYDMVSGHIRQLETGIAAGAATGVSVEEALCGKDISDKNKDLFADTIKRNGDMIRLQRLYLSGGIEEAYRLVEGMTPPMTVYEGFANNAECVFYSILTRLAMHPCLSGVERRHNQRAVRKQLHELKYCVRVYRGNHYARYLLARAEYAAVFAHGRSSAELCQEAMAFAEQQSSLPLEALSNLLAAKYHHGNPKLSKFFRFEAERLYRKWGAAYVADLIAREMDPGRPEEVKPAQYAEAASEKYADAPPEKPVLPSGAEDAGGKGSVEEDTRRGMGRDCPNNAGQNAQSGIGRDILFHLNEMEKLDEDGKYLYLLDLLVSRKDADYCAVFFEKTDEMHIKYEQRGDGEGKVYPEAINMNHLSGLPHKIIRYVARTGIEILMAPGDPSELFANDPYLADRAALSLACLPIRYSGVPVGMIYLEKEGGNMDKDSLSPFVKGFLSSISSAQAGVKETGRPGGRKPQNARQLFTERELEVLRLVAEGKSNAEISGQLFITLGTVKNHLRNIYGKLDADSRVKAVLKARELKIIQI